MTGISYEDFVDTGYEPADSDLVCAFVVDPADGIDMLDAAGRVASESSNGTWARLQVDGSITDLSARAFHVEGDRISVAYPEALFEGGNMAQILSCIAGNILGMKAVDAIRLADCRWPSSLTDTFPGPQFGSAVREEIFDAGDRPITASVPKPKVGLSTDQHVEIGYQIWAGGIDLLKDDENLTDQAFNPYEDRLTESLAQRDRAAEETGDPKSYLINVTADGNRMLERIDLAAEHGCEYVMVDVVTCGWSSVQQVRRRCEKHGIAIHAHRAMHAAFDRIPYHGVSMRVLAQVARLCGVDQIHTGTAGLGKLANEDTVGINRWLTDDCHGLTDVLPVASGGLHPGLLPQLVDALGTNIAIQVGGGIHGHPDGSRAGAEAVRAATDGIAAGESLASAAEGSQALATALDTWGREGTR
jgi:ribulose-bisphosphate carboxylase large chain